MRLESNPSRRLRPRLRFPAQRKRRQDGGRSVSDHVAGTLQKRSINDKGENSPQKFRFGGTTSTKPNRASIKGDLIHQKIRGANAVQSRLSWVVQHMSGRYGEVCTDGQRETEASREPCVRVELRICREQITLSTAAAGFLPGRCLQGRIRSASMSGGRRKKPSQERRWHWRFTRGCPCTYSSDRRCGGRKTACRGISAKTAAVARSLRTRTPSAPRENTPSLANCCMAVGIPLTETTIPPVQHTHRERDRLESAFAPIVPL